MSLIVWIWKQPIPYPKSMKEYWRKHHNPLIKELRKCCDGAGRVLDVGCGSCSPIAYLKADYKVGIDIWKPSLKKAIERKIYDETIAGDVLEVCKQLKRKDFNLVLCLDVLEHLEKQKAFSLISEMQRVGRKVVVITPLGWFSQGKEGGNPFQKHFSAWNTNDFEKRGFKTKVIETKRCKQIVGVWKQ